MSKVTILTQTYNREHLLPRAIEHVLSQTFTDFTYLIVDNAIISLSSLEIFS